MNRVALLIGGNQGDRRFLLEQATVLIQKCIGTVVAVSRVYETEPWGDFGEGVKVQNFLNQALLVESELSAHEVLHMSLSIEATLGRMRSDSNGKDAALQGAQHSTARIYHSRPIDIDLIFFNDETIDTADLTIPHPRMHLRRFVLEPLSEIMPDYRHPILGRTVSEMLKNLVDDRMAK